MDTPRCKEKWRAGFIERAGAFSLDLLLIIWTYTVALRVVVRQPLADGLVSFLRWYIVVLGGLALLSVVYFSFLNSEGRQTLGKRVFGLRAVRCDKSPLGWRRSLIRSAAYLVSEGVFYLGFLWVLWDKKREAWHDKLAGTAVEVVRPQTPGSRALAVLCLACLAISSMFPSSAVKSRFRAFTTPTSSMLMTLLPGDYFIADLGVPGFRELVRGDVIIFEPPRGDDQTYIKRCVALGGQDVLVKRNLLFLDGKLVSEPYVHLTGLVSPYADHGPVHVPTSSVYVLGDNRDNSLDSRHFGPLARDLILGRADLIYWSMDPDRAIPRVDRVGKRIE